MEWGKTMITLYNINKKYKNKQIFSNLSIQINDNEFVCISGDSGAGKTTLLNIMGLSDSPDSGDVIIDNHENPDSKQIQQLRRNKIGYIFQNYGLVENETVQQNLDITSRFRTFKGKEKQFAYEQALEQLSLPRTSLKEKVYRLSGGEQQRIAISRLLITKPEFIFADEPTGNLDRNNRDIVFQALRGFHKNGATVVYVSHDKELIDQAHMHIRLPF